MALGEIAYLLPWTFVALVGGLAAAWRKRRDERRLFLICLALPPIVLFTLTPLWGARGLPQWTMSGWLFAFPLMGLWLDERATPPSALRRWAFVSCGGVGRRGGRCRRAGVDRLPCCRFPGRSPIRRWRLSPGAGCATRRAAERSLPSCCRPAGRTPGRSRSRSVPPCLSLCCPAIPRGWAFVEGGQKLLGGDGVLIARAADVSFGAGRGSARLHGRSGRRNSSRSRETARPEIELALVPVHGLTRGLPLPYPDARGG